jgi:hypothetical protein
MRGGGRSYHAAGARRLEAAGGRLLTFDQGGVMRATDSLGMVSVFERVEGAQPDLAQLRELAGTYASLDAEARYVVAVEAGQLVVRQRPGTVLKLLPVYRDAFRAGGDLVIFRRDAQGKVNALSVVQDRVWDMRFELQM